MPTATRESPRPRRACPIQLGLVEEPLGYTGVSYLPRMVRVLRPCLGYPTRRSRGRRHLAHGWQEKVQDQWYVSLAVAVFVFSPSLAFSTFLLAMGITAGIIQKYGPEAFSIIYEKWVGFITASVLMSLIQAIAVYAMSFQEGKLLALGGNSGNFIYDVRYNCALSSFLPHCKIISVLHRP